MRLVVRGHEALSRFMRLVQYNKDWGKYLFYLHARGPVQPIAFRLRNGQNITISSDARWTLNELYLDHVYDVPGVDWSRCQNVLDLGANVGLFALYVASRNPSATIHCFEPEQRNFAMLIDNMGRNKLKAKAYQIAVSGTCRRARLQLSGSVSHTLSDVGESSAQVDCVNLAKVLELTGVDRFDFSKIDIEGSEKEILDSATEDQVRRLGVMSMEWHWTIEQMHQAAKKLRAMGLETQCSANEGRYLKAWKAS